MTVLFGRIYEYFYFLPKIFFRYSYEEHGMTPFPWNVKPELNKSQKCSLWDNPMQDIEERVMSCGDDRRRPFLIEPAYTMV